MSQMTVFSSSVKMPNLQISFSRDDELKKGKTTCRYLLQVSNKMVHVNLKLIFANSCIFHA